MDSKALSTAMGGSLPQARYAALLPSIEAAMAAAGITTVDRAAMWLAQIGHESGGLRWMEELASGEAYEGRADLGNTQRGDGKRFKGRGAIMLTGRANYSDCSRWAHSKGLVPTPTYFVDNPAELASDRYGFLGAVWFWTVARPNLNALSDRGDLNEVTRLINGGYTHLDDRRERYVRCKGMGSRILIGGNSMGGLSDREARELLDRVRYIYDQLAPKHPAWPDSSSMGKDEKGAELTFRDGVAAYIRRVGDGGKA